jgi:hypothetical protein
MKVRVSRKAVLVVVAVCGLAFAAWTGWRATADPVADAATTRILMDAETGQLVPFRLDPQFSGFPAVNPKTGRATLYPTEVCRSPTCAARGGTHVILNKYLGKEGPTHCPVCGAEVRFHNGGRE